MGHVKPVVPARDERRGAAIPGVGSATAGTRTALLGSLQRRERNYDQRSRAVARLRGLDARTMHYPLGSQCAHRLGMRSTLECCHDNALARLAWMFLARSLRVSVVL